MTKTEYIWMNGSFVKWDEANVHVLSHVVHYGSSWFEGVRSYKTRKGRAIFRLDDHLKRLEYSLKIYHSQLPYTVTELCHATLETVRRSGLDECYIRPFAFRGYGELGLFPFNCPIEVAIAVWPWGKYLGAEAHDKGVDVGVSSWNRLTPNTMPTMAKSGGNYMNSQLVRIEAANNGYAEGISLDSQGFVSEGSGENIFIVCGDTIYTPAMGGSILPGITRASVITLAKECGYTIVETAIPRGLLYTCDELFFTGTAVEITPIRTVDRVAVGDGTVGPITKKLQERFYSVVRDGEDPHGWLTFVDSEHPHVNGAAQTAPPKKKKKFSPID